VGELRLAVGREVHSTAGSMRDCWLERSTEEG
jgi:hypothetical protein